jgi:hypothetical protein
MPRCLLAGVACSLLVLPGDLNSSEPLKSGPQVGSANDREGFTPKWVTGPCAGNSLCPV